MFLLASHIFYFVKVQDTRQLFLFLSLLESFCFAVQTGDTNNFHASFYYKCELWKNQSIYDQIHRRSQRKGYVWLSNTVERA